MFQTNYNNSVSPQTSNPPYIILTVPSQLNQSMEGKNQEVVQLHAERDLYEENMKKAFMRGVCALNMEAMTMFKYNEDRASEDRTSVNGSVHLTCVLSAWLVGVLGSSLNLGCLWSFSWLSAYHHKLVVWLFIPC